MKKIKKMRKKEQEYEKMKKKMDAKARTIIRHSIDAKAFERSTYDCKTAHKLWKTLQPTEAYTEEEIHRALGRVRIETCSNAMELVAVSSITHVLSCSRKLIFQTPLHQLNA